MAMPETTVYQNDSTAGWKNKIGLSWQPCVVESVTKAASV